ncbi:hypothetical protein BWQ96_09530 [Gracilariopsis chorda]|uniref:Uncharacterized protein n=1 Tax=Gracilariopsis chorda TaxID=448386 RepID=A0A2V3IFG4_9FLOR|nr:hypothetical protein BWQ96_09530 [Gracilariopsis chorda]|eukprot:PXF40768.1 hypothetical protein BWQ96_09530 [Gracilariopsis chorda]
MMVHVLSFLVAALVCKCATGVPMSMVTKCGKAGIVLSLEEERFCCEQFKLNCPLLKAVEADSVVEQIIRTGTDGEDKLKVHVRNLGERCKPPLYVCAVGLHCMQGFCFRKKTKSHLRRLMERGKEIEEEERSVIDDDDDNDEDPLLARDDQILRGQSIKVSDNTNLKHSLAAGTHGSVGIRGLGPNNIESSGMEEDELAANIGDLLSKTMGVKLSSKQIHDVREVIAGTFDERAEREEQVDAAEGILDAENNETAADSLENSVTRDKRRTTHAHLNSGKGDRMASENERGGRGGGNISHELAEREERRGCENMDESQERHQTMQCPARYAKRNNAVDAAAAHAAAIADAIRREAESLRM